MMRDNSWSSSSSESSPGFSGATTCCLVINAPSGMCTLIKEIVATCAKTTTNVHSEIREKPLISEEKKFLLTGIQISECVRPAWSREHRAQKQAALAWRCDHRASFGTQNTFSARYSSGSSAADGSSASKAECLASNASEMYFRKIRLRIQQEGFDR